MTRMAQIVSICAVLVLAAFLVSCSVESPLGTYSNPFKLSECSLTESVEYDGVSFRVDPSWHEDLQEGICTWTISDDLQIELVLTTYAKQGFPETSLARCSMHLYKPKYAWSRGSDFYPYEGNRDIAFGIYKGEGKNEDGEDMVDYFLSGIHYENGDYFIAYGSSFMIELIYPDEISIRDEEEFMRSIAETVQWDPSKTELDSVELGYSVHLSPLDVRGN